MLLNIYAEFNRWDEVEKVRNFMKDQKVETISGHNWIEISNKVYSFQVGD